MKTLEQILERIKNNTYHEPDMYYILGYLEAKGVIMDDYEFNTPESSDNKEDFTEWFEGNEVTFGLSMNGYVHINPHLLQGNKKEEKIVYKYQGEERKNLKKKLKYSEGCLHSLKELPHGCLSDALYETIRNLKDSIRNINRKLQETINEE